MVVSIVDVHDLIGAESRRSIEAEGVIAEQSSSPFRNESASHTWIRTVSEPLSGGLGTAPA
jgi:hypothetical protein